MMACAYAAAFGAIQQVPRIVPGLPEVRALPRPAAGTDRQRRAVVSGVRRTGGPDRARIPRGAHREPAPAAPGLPGARPDRCCRSSFLGRERATSTLLKWGIFVLGFMTIGQFSFWGNYLPRVYPTHLRGTGESFAANVGGRMIGTCAALVTTQLVAVHARRTRCRRKLAYAAAIVGTSAYVIGFAMSYWLPEPKAGSAGVEAPWELCLGEVVAWRHGGHEGGDYARQACGSPAHASRRSVQSERARTAPGPPPIERPWIERAGPLRRRVRRERRRQVAAARRARASDRGRPAARRQLVEPVAPALAGRARRHRARPRSGARRTDRRRLRAFQRTTCGSMTAIATPWVVP